MKKIYITPSIETTNVHVLCDTSTTSTLSNNDTTSKYTVKERKDDESYESESGNYGDLW